MIKHCPFCGETKNFTIEVYDDELAWVVCKKCQAVGPEANSKEKAIKKWNKRVI